MEYILNKKIQIFSNAAKDYIDAEKITVSFKGKKGLLKIKKLQDIVFKSFMSQTNTSKESKDNEDTKDITVDELLTTLQVLGTSETITSEILEALKDFATIENEKITDNIIDELDMDDIDEICNGVLKHFLLPKVTLMLNNLSK